MNLCANAEYAMRGSGGVLEIRLVPVTVGLDRLLVYPELKPGRYVCLIVRDTGAGINSENIQRIFDPFFTTKTIGEGSGMGLSVVHGIVANHGGKISVDTNLGQGTTFALYFPAFEGVQVPDASRRSDQELFYGSGHVLYIEDEEPLAKLGQEILERLGYTVTMCASSVEALAAFRSDPFRFDVVITDQTMPNMTGDVLARQILEIRAEVPIILCTGFSHLITPEKAKAIGIRAFLMKPLMVRDLGRVLHEIVPPKTNV